MRDILRWKNIDLLLYPKHSEYNFVPGQALEQMANLTHPIKTLSISMRFMVEKDMKNLCAIGSTIERLDLVYGAL